ncbi:serine hydrolase domain-containing protein [Sphingomonas sp. ST-64]|uniref:Serine hydrolase domain-containing protein n=1 Tax=Sphingomonas plantiphila TaxID=3163295 RepID=A0ABW8YSQ7_9SPHN
MQRPSSWLRATAALALIGAALPAAANSRAPVPAATYTIPPARIAGLADFVDGVMAQQIATREVAGAVVTVVYQGRILFSRGYGFADVDKGIPVDGMRTLFRPGSTGKMFTWSALLQQVEAGKVDLDADVNKYLDFRIPEFEGQPIRVRDLFAHAVGMSDVGDLTAPSVDRLVPYQQWMKSHVPQRLWPAGTETSYSNYGSVIAGYIVERVSGMPFPDYVEKHIFRPLGMTSTTFREPLPAALAPRMAKGYVVKDGKLVAEPFELFSPVMPAGSASSSGADMSRFMLAMLGGGAWNGKRILSAKSVAYLMSDSRANAPDLQGMAHGFFVVRKAGPRLVGHGGNTGDFHSNMILAPEAGLGFFVSETGGAGSYGGRTELTEALIGRLFPVDPAPRVAAPAGERVPVGAYRMNRRDYARPADPDNDWQVVAAGPDAITLVIDGAKTHWERIGPQLYERRTGARAGGPFERLQFYGGAGKWRMSLSSLPHVAFHRVKP